ncbi:MAG TPA: hypothetical protein VFW45_12945 [Candidatus Polarisedimenticolia bacterium]|nr:hypothetical protein [Candidatus Polarisedimenticolia bacterium]
MRSYRSPFLDVPIRPDPVIELYKQDIDRSLLRANLKLTPQERLEALMAFQQSLEELRNAGERAKAVAELEALMEEQQSDSRD